LLVLLLLVLLLLLLVLLLLLLVLLLLLLLLAVALVLLASPPLAGPGWSRNNANDSTLANPPLLARTAFACACMHVLDAYMCMRAYTHEEGAEKREHANYPHQH
jgi:hypothetical protein